MSQPGHILQELEDGLILRRSTIEDLEALADFNGQVHADPGQDFSDEAANVVRVLLSGSHPTFNPGDFTIVEDPKSGKIVSSLCLIDQTWAYEGIQFGVGRPELVGTHKDYRRRGLVRKQFEIIHQWSATRDQKLQAITGIPWYYRQFGYEMAVNLGGSRRGYLPNIPTLAEGQEEPYRFRQVDEKDIPFVAKLYNQSRKRQMVSCVRDESIWHYELFYRIQPATAQFEMHIIETPVGRPVGYLLTRPNLSGNSLTVNGFEIVEGISWFEAAHAVLRQLAPIAQSHAQPDATPENPKEMNSFVFALGEDHPIYHVIPNRMPLQAAPYAFYVRVPDLQDFIRLIAPVLEERLARSYMAGHTGELKLNFFTEGILLSFERGKLLDVRPWDSPNFAEASGNFPNLTFLQLLFGYRDVQELDNAYADLYFRQEEGKILLKSLFPRKPSHVLELT